MLQIVDPNVAKYLFRVTKVGLLLCWWKRVFAKTSAFSWQNSVSLCPASFCTAKPNLPITPGISCLPTFAFQSPIMKRHLFWVLVLEGLVGLCRTVQLPRSALESRRVSLGAHWVDSRESSLLRRLERGREIGL